MLLLKSVYFVTRKKKVKTKSITLNYYPQNNHGDRILTK